MKKVSIVIPVYNVENYIEETLNSFINQTLKDIEIIVVDDGSTDSTCNILEKYADMDQRIVILHQKNQGAGIARNLGMEHATGKYLYFFDGDDWCIPSFLQKVVRKAEETNADITVFDYYRIDETSKKEVLYYGLNRALLPKGKDVFNYKDVPDRILSIVNPTPWNKLYLRQYVQNTKLQFLGLSTTNDITFAALSVAMAGKITYVAEPFMYYRINRKNATTSFKQKKLNNVIIAVNSVIEQAQALPYEAEIKLSIAYFAMANLIYALENYAGNFRSRYYREYYHQLHGLFNTELFTQCSHSDINNNKLYEQYNDIRTDSYTKLVCKKALEKGKSVFNKCVKSIFPLTMGKFEYYNKKESSEQKEIKKMQNSVRKLTKEVKELKEMIQMLNTSLNISGITSYQRNPRIIVSMTSYPARIYKVSKALESIMAQTIKADKIILWLAKDNFPNGINELPEGLVNMQSRGLEIKWTETDYKSYKKVIQALQEYPDDIVVTVDDDLIYDKRMLELLYDSFKRNPDAISAMRVHRIAFKQDGTIAPYSEWSKEDSSFIDEGRMDLMATTGAGTLFPPRILPQQTLDWSVIEEVCPLADDIWMKMMSVINGVKTVLVHKQHSLVYIDGTQEDTLWSLNISQNDVQLANILKYYSEIDFLGKMQR